MSANEPQPEIRTVDATQVRHAIDALEAIIRDRALLNSLSPEDRQRLLTAAGDVFCPDVRQRRRQVKERQRQRKATKIDRTEEILHQTGIRELRRRPVFTTPNAYPPALGEPVEVDDAEFREVVEPQNCYICKQDYQLIHHFYDQLCPDCAELNFRKRTETADLRGRVALLTGGRVKIGYQAGIKLLRA
ncbi:MAG: oxidoreductase, partial [Verrucomicrobiae bacterium]|nr:oxidoreductase [Verrucomicrobiae bacterium]